METGSSQRVQALLRSLQAAQSPQPVHKPTQVPEPKLEQPIQEEAAELLKALQGKGRIIDIRV
jgi:hypothetical protein